MKLQNLTVIFIIIIIPVILLVSLYISTGLKTIKYQTLYDTGLLTSTHDAVYAFELNTANDKLANNPEVKRSIIKSSIKMFERSLANTCGISAYNLEDIEEYIPAVVFGMYDGFYMYAPSVVYNGDKKEYKHNLKNYVYYSETLDDGTVIIYSLDNYVVVSGKFDGTNYEVREGYLIVKDEWKDYIDETDLAATAYYNEAEKFTEWFNENIGNKVEYLEIDDDNDPEDNDSAFVQNKRKVIKDKIENVLNSSITAYSERTWKHDYKMPKFSVEDWEKIYSNISMITFFQGKSIGLTKYNNYCVLNSTNSREYVNPNLMYFIDNTGTYHDIRCDHKSENLTGYKIGAFQKKKVEQKDENGNIKVDENENVLYQYEYDHNELACYYCINGQLDTDKSIQKYISNANKQIKTAYWTSLARERYNTTKLIGSTQISGVTEINVEVTGYNESDQVSFELYKNGEKFKDITVNSSDNWKTTIKGLDEYSDGVKAEYELRGYENNIEEYEGTLTVDGNTWTINYAEIPKINKKVIVKFDDDNNQDGKRPNDINVKLNKNANGTTIKVGEVNLSNNESYTWTELPTKENGKDVYYYLEGESISGYKSSMTGENEITLTYTYIPEIIQIEIKIEWDDEHNTYGTRPDSVEIKIKGQNNTTSKTLSKNETNPEKDFKDKISLPKYNNGQEIQYEISEVVPNRYKVEYEENNGVVTINHILQKVTKWEQNGSIVYGKNDAGDIVTELKLGDYINYDCYTGVDSSKLTYTSLGTNTGYSTNQVFTVSSAQKNMKWQLLGVENGSLVIIPENPQAPNNSSIYYLIGKNGFINGTAELNEISKIYGNGNYAISSRSINIEDINKVTGYNPNNTGAGKKYGEGNLYEYGNTVTYSLQKDNFFTGDYYKLSARGSNGKESTPVGTNNAEYFDNGFKQIEKNTSIDMISTYYRYYPTTLTDNSNGSTKGIKETSAEWEMLFNKYYWLSSRQIRCSDSPDFVINAINGKYVGLNGWIYTSSGRDNSDLYQPYKVCPVVTLESDIQLDKQTDGSYNISELK